MWFAGVSAAGRVFLTYQLSSAAMDFFDDDHLLFTFRTGGLLKRAPGDPRGRRSGDPGSGAGSGDGEGRAAGAVADARSLAVSVAV